MALQPTTPTKKHMRQSDSFEEEPEPEDFFDYVKATSDNDDDYIFNLTNTSRRAVDTSEEETNDSTKESPLINIFRTGKLHSKLGRSAEKRPRLSQDGFGRGRKVTVVKHDNKKNRPRSREDSDEEDDYRRKLNKSISEERKKEKEGKKAPRGNRERERKRKSRRMVKLVDEEDNECREHLSKSAFLEKKRVRDSDIFSRRAKSISPVRSNQKIQLALEISRSRFEPTYKGHQLMGDSQFVRFAEQILNAKVDRGRRIMYSISGQRINDLKERLVRGLFPINQHVIVMIGTNDILNNTNYELMEKGYSSILDHLKNHCSKIILLTVPPVAKLEDDWQHWQRLRKFNTFIVQQIDGERIFAVDLAPFYLHYNNKCNHTLYEQRFSGSERIDLIHLNKLGLKLLQWTLDEFYFNNYSSLSN